MVFSSITFVYAFFPLVAVAYYLSKNRVYRNVVLLLASLLFYSWGEPRFLLLMLAATLAAYCGGLLMERSTAHKRLILIVTVVLLVGNLFVFKYLNFFSENLSALFGWRALPKLTLPIGISFYTFQILSYVIDLYRGEIRVQRNYFYLLLYVSFFPQLIAGPIVRYETVEQEILERRESIDDVAAGLRRFILGLAKKVILANNIARIAETIYAGDSAVYGTTLYWLAAVAYALQIYFDFSGYSDMAIGLGRMFGFHFLENFDHPYTALSITDFWRRWHISLSTWFRDYVYIPLGGNRVKKSRWIRNILVVWGADRLLARRTVELPVLGPVLRASAAGGKAVSGASAGAAAEGRALALYGVFRADRLGAVQPDRFPVAVPCAEAHVCPAGDGLGGSRCHERLPSEGRCLPAARYRVLSAAAAPGAEEHKGHSAGRPCLRSSADRVHRVHSQLVV